MGRKDKEISLSGEMTGQQVLEQKKKKKRKKIVLTVVIIVIVVLLLVIAGVAIAVSQAMKKMAGGTVTLARPETGDIVSEISVTGHIESEQTIHYTAPSNLIVAEVVPAGSYVKKGDVILKFDEEDYKIAMRQLEINGKMTENTYQSSLTGDGQIRNKIAKAQADVVKYEAEVAEKQAKYDASQGSVNRYEENDNSHYSRKLSYNKKNGYIQIDEIDHKYFIQFVFNYAKFEAYVDKKDLVPVINNMCSILRTIKFNDAVLDSLIGENALDYKEEDYTLFKADSSKESFLDVVEREETDLYKKDLEDEKIELDY